MFRFIGGRMRRPSGPRIAQTVLAAAVFLGGPTRLAANVIFYSGNLRANATVTDCGTACTLGPFSTDGDYAQWAAAVYTFTVDTTTTMEAITYGYAGGTSLTGAVVAAGGLEPYLSLFDAGGNFLASTYYGTSSPRSELAWRKLLRRVPRWGHPDARNLSDRAHGIREHVAG